MIHSSKALLAIGLLSLFCALGCSSSVSVPQWQQQVERYVREDGRGDPNVLRNMTIEGGRPGFAIIGADDPHASTDAKGLLLAHKRIGERPWFIYLVGLVNKQEVGELQLTALSVRNGQYRWALGKADGQALKTYKSYNEQIGRQRSGQSKAPVVFRGFPQEGDDFDVTVEGNRINAVHRESGARWSVGVPG
jgi:hypothetical protein